MPNAWDVGSARILVSMGFRAIATTSSGHAASLGRLDQRVTFDEMLRHVEELVSAVDVPISVDSENLFAESAEGVAANVKRIAATGASGLSIEDFDPATGILPVGVAVERVAAASDAAKTGGMTLTARAENHLYEAGDLEGTITRLAAYRDAGADVLYAPGLTDRRDIERLTGELASPLNVLARPDGPTVAELADAGVRRVSTGGALAFAAYGALVEAARELLATGTSRYGAGAMSLDDRRSAFDG